MIKSLKKRLRKIYTKPKLTKEIREEYFRDLNKQSSQFLLISGLLAIFAWPGFILIDKSLHPEIPLLLPRLGLSLSGIVLLVLNFSLPAKTREKHGAALLSIPVFYLVSATPWLTALVDSDAPYLNGLGITTMLIPVLPVPFRLSVFFLFISSTVYFVFQPLSSFVTPADFYNLNNIVITYALSLSLCYVMDIIRFQSFQRGLELKNNLKETENLLANILPEEVAVELKTFGSSSPIKYQSVSVLFTDFVGFTNYAKDLDPEELVKQLDQCFSYFDSLMEDYHLEKLKTIGDAYMCAGGVPTPNLSHPVDSVLAALEMKDFVLNMKSIKKAQNKPYWDIRIGINTGSLVAGVVGKIKFAYDVWGESVNTASRMEAYGISNEVNISKTTYEMVKDYFDCEYRGKIDVKNDSGMDMYLVKGIKSDLCETVENQRLPNEAFREKYHKELMAFI